jgi:hypothetical protein
VRSASITYMIWHYVARRAQVIEDHPHNAELSVLSDIYLCFMAYAVMVRLLPPYFHDTEAISAIFIDGTCSR